MSTRDPAGLPITLRCYAYHDRENPERWLAHCIDVDVMASGKSFEDARHGLHNAIDLFLESVSELDDEEAVLQLLSRKAPLSVRAKWRLVRLLASWRDDGPDS